ncbi:cell division cycle-associated protein 2 [Nematolebias whitei]|uniref:cell division cycle-associated protein 2 n=1 Tax=Nematolebias whitei TaxID=451745 RepID=UPI00189A272E|nr:cell division cycle-associated protein 2 [Nematolebias whitei]
MAAVEPIAPGPEDQEEKMSQSEDCVLNETSVYLNFSELTPSQFGISIKSFTPSSTCKDKTHAAQIKARRRSSVGARGSPETNSLIRFIAHQRMKTPPASQTAEPVRSSPFFPPVASTLRQKMANFQSLMDHACDPVPVQDGDTGGCIMTRDYLSDGISCSEGKENTPPTRPTPSKKRRLGPLEGCSVEIREEAIGQHQRPSRPASDPAAVLPPHQSSPPHISPVSPHLEIKPSDVNSTETPVVKKKKQVHFGDPLSPEFFDKNLPPSTPLQKGGTPARAPTPGGSLQLRSVLKTPQTSESNTPHHQLELYSPTEFGDSPTLAIPHKRRRLSEEADGEDGKIAFPAMEEFDSAMTSDSECALGAQLLNVNMASLWEPVPHVLTVNFVFFQQPEESTPVKRSTRSAAKLACGKMKKASAARRWDKDVDRSLYGSREYASKNPSLSPIRERQSLSSLTPAAQPTPQRCTTPSQEPLTVSDVVSNTEADDGFVVRRATDNAPQDSLTSPYSGQEDSRLLRSTVRRRRRKVSVPDSQEAQDQAGQMEQLFEDQTSSSSEFSAGTTSESSEAPQAGTEELDAQTPAATSCTDAGTEDRTCLHASTSYCPPSAEEPSTTELKQKRAKRGRRSSALHEPQKCPEEHQSSCDVEENGLRARAEGQPENKWSSDSQEEVGGAFTFVHLAPWQSDFNVEDVFKPAARRGQRSVRRSLRNQHSSEQSGSMAGLAWLPHVSPDSVKEARRKTRHRRLSAALPVQPPLHEETQDASLDGLRAAGEN